MNILDYMLNDMIETLSNESVFTEKATTEQYRLSKFKKKYHYDPSKKTIVVNGETYKADLDHYKSGIMYVKDTEGNKVATIRQMSADTRSDDPEIHFDRNFFNLKNSKRADAVLQHEIGHTKLHNSNLDGTHTDKSAISGSAFNEMIKVIYRIAEPQYNEYYKSIYGRPMNTAEKKELIRAIKNEIMPRKDEYMRLSEDRRKGKLRDDMLKIAKKYAKTSKASHTNTQEFEADRYAANRTSEKDIKRGVRETYKHATTDKQIKKQLKVTGASTDKKTVNSQRKAINKEGQVDMNQRSKALKDKKLRSSEVYQ